MSIHIQYNRVPGKPMWCKFVEIRIQFTPKVHPWYVMNGGNSQINNTVHVPNVMVKSGNIDKSWNECIKSCTRWDMSVPQKQHAVHIVLEMSKFTHSVVNNILYSFYLILFNGENKHHTHIGMHQDVMTARLTTEGLQKLFQHT